MLKKAIEINDSILSRLKYVLEFYADEENYPSLINLDCGITARVLIDDIEEIVKNANTLDDVNDEFNIHSLGDDEINDIVNKIKTNYDK